MLQVWLPAAQGVVESWVFTMGQSFDGFITWSNHQEMAGKKLRESDLIRKEGDGRPSLRGLACPLPFPPSLFQSVFQSLFFLVVQLRSAASAASSMAFCLCTGQKQGGHPTRIQLLKVSQIKSFLYFSRFSRAFG